MSETRLSHICDLSALSQAVSDGLVHTQLDPTGKFRIFNYSPEAQYSRAWTPEVRMSRGLIIRPDDPSSLVSDGVVVARPFEKYFNHGEPEAPSVPQAPFVVTDKLDGSLGIAYVDFDGSAPVVRIATRGSFSSPQAQAATSWLASTHPEWVPPAGVTYLFEWIAPENRIVLNYGARRELVLLAIIDNASGADLALPGTWPGAVVTHFDGISDFAQVLEMMETTAGSEGEVSAEGFVIRFDAGPDRPSARVKVKYAEYVALHRLITGTNARTLWQALVADRLADVNPVLREWAMRCDEKTRLEIEAVGGLKATLAELPDELYSWASEIVSSLEEAFDRKVAAHSESAAELAALNISERRELATQLLALAKERGLDSSLLFSMLDGNEERWRASIWRSLRPEADAGLNPMAATLDDVA